MISMRAAALVALLALSAAQPLFAQNVPPTEDSVRHLLDLVQTHRILDQALSTMDEYMQKAMEQARQEQGQTLNAKQQQIVDQFRTDMVSAIKDELAWSNIEPDYVSAYVKTFSQKEINDMIAFYSSPSGQSVANKLPLVSQQMTADMQQKMLPLIQKMKQAQRDMMTRLKAAASEN
jgi:uncharacterized protein